MPVRLCTEPRCPLVATHRGRCPEHARQRNRDIHRNRHIYNSKRWRILRRRVLYDHPICQACDRVLATDVDHVDPSYRAGRRPVGGVQLAGVVCPVPRPQDEGRTGVTPRSAVTQRPERGKAAGYSDSPTASRSVKRRIANAIATTTINTTPVAPNLKSRPPTSSVSIPLPSFRSEPQRTAGIWGRKGKAHLLLRHRPPSISPWSDRVELLTLVRPDCSRRVPRPERGRGGSDPRSPAPADRRVTRRQEDALVTKEEDGRCEK